MNAQDICAAASARLVAQYTAQQREESRFRLVGALRSIPPNDRASEAEAAIKRLAQQELLEAKLKALSHADLEKVQIG